MSDEKTPLRGDAAWRAAKAEIADRNEKAYARGREVRAAQDAEQRARRVAADRADRANLPKQPRPK
jgi:hypothetical protein